MFYTGTQYHRDLVYTIIKSQECRNMQKLIPTPTSLWPQYARASNGNSRRTIWNTYVTYLYIYIYMYQNESPMSIIDIVIRVLWSNKCLIMILLLHILQPAVPCRVVCHYPTHRPECPGNTSRLIVAGSGCLHRLQNLAIVVSASESQANRPLSRAPNGAGPAPR